LGSIKPQRGTKSTNIWHALFEKISNGAI
jgi:hypothetical protein